MGSEAGFVVQGRSIIAAEMGAVMKGCSVQLVRGG